MAKTDTKTTDTPKPNPSETEEIRHESTGSPSLDEAKTGGETPEAQASKEQSPDFNPNPTAADAPEGPKVSVKVTGNFMVHDVTTGESVDPDGNCHDVTRTAFISGRLTTGQLEEC